MTTTRTEPPRPEPASALSLVGYVRTLSPGSRLAMREQEQALYTWARSRRHLLTSIGRDRGAIAKSEAGRRIGLYESLAAIGDRRANGLLLYRLDVLDRQTTTQEAILGVVWEFGGEVFTCVSGRIDPMQSDVTDRTRVECRQAVRTFSEVSHKITATRMERRRRRKLARGGYAGGAPLFGYRVDTGQLIADAHEQAAISRIVELRRLGLSLRSIADTLFVEGYRPKRADYWHPENLRRILARAAASE